jgi:AcrR family transcriptional regulator
LASKDTKEKILEASLKLFNEQGFVNVRLQHISDDTIISLGNITYHFRTKDDIILALWEEVEYQQKILLTESRMLPLFQDIDRYLELNFAIHQTYTFFYKDTLELHRAYPQIAEQYIKHLAWQEQQLENIIHFNVARGSFVEASFDIQYQSLAKLWQSVSDGWIYRIALTGRESAIEAYKSTIWHLLWPYFSDRGKMEYQQLFDLKKLNIHA